MVGLFGSGGMKIDRYDETLFQEMIRFRPDIVFLFFFFFSGNDIHSKSEPKQVAENVLAFVRTLKTNKMTCAQSDQSLHCPWITCSPYSA